MQETFGENVDLRESFKKSLSSPRFLTYLKVAGSDDLKAIELYQWNAKLSQSMYIYLQGWEVCLRNKLNDFLSWKYNSNWPYDPRAIRQLNGNDKRRLQEAKDRQESQRCTAPAPISAIVADLSAGFWVSLLSKNYEIPFAWRYNLKRVFPIDAALTRRPSWEICNDMLNLRNRVAHHEPIFTLPLSQQFRDLQRIVAAMCPATHAYCEASCSFEHVLLHRP